jgi:cobalt-zinc-cadmium efflux system outer membrane protein
MFYRVFISLLILSGHNLSAQKLYTITEAITEARNNNPELKAEKYSISIASASITTARLRPNPIFNNQSLQLLNKQYSPVKTISPSPSNQQLWYQMTKPMLLGGVRAKRIDFAKQGVVSATTFYSELNRTVSYNTALKWLDAWQVKNRILLYKEAKEHLDSLIYLNKKNEKDKVGSSIEKIRSQLLSDQYHIRLKSENNLYIDELRNLKYILGINDSINILDEINFIAYDFFKNKDSLMFIALERRSDLAYAKSTIELSRKNIVVQDAARLPYFEGGFIYNPQNRIPYAGTFATLSVPVFSRNQGEREKAHIMLKQSESYKTAKEMQIKMEVENAHFSFVNHKDILDESQLIVDESLVLLNSIKAAYMEGQMSIVDYMEAQGTYIEMQTLHLEADYNFRKSYIDVLFSTGLILDLN